MATKKKKSKRGGARPGAGPKFTGVNTVYLRSCVHKDFAEEAKALVKAKYAEWKAKRAGSVPKVNDKSVESPKIPAAKPVEAKKAVSKAPKVAVAPVNEAAQSFLNKRREGKLK